MNKYTWCRKILGIRRGVSISVMVISATLFVMTFFITCDCDFCKDEHEISMLRFSLVFAFVSFLIIFVSYYIFRTEFIVNDVGVTIIKRKKVHKQYHFNEYGFGFRGIDNYGFPILKFIEQFTGAYKICVVHRETQKSREYFCFDFSEKIMKEFLLEIYQRNQLLVHGTNDTVYALALRLQAQSRQEELKAVKK